MAAITIATMMAWIAVAALTFADFKGVQDPRRIIAWVACLGAASLMTTDLVRRSRVTALSALAPMDRLWAELEQLERAPQIGRGYRIAPELVDAEAELEAVAEEEGATTSSRA